MLENQIISKMIKDRDISILQRNNLKKEHFLANGEVVDYINKYYIQYKTTPSEDTIVNKFPHFIFTEAEDSEEFIANQLQEALVYTKLAPILEKGAEKTREDSIESIQYLKREIDHLITLANKREGAGKDIIASSEERLEDYEQRVAMDGMLGIPSGIKQLDEITFGWMPEDLITIFARTSEGKSWITLYLLVEAWKQGKKVLLYSGEMSHLMVGYRLDTYLGHFSNRALMSGNRSEQERYQQHIAKLREKEGFVVITPSDLGNRRPTVQDIKELVEIHNPDIVGIDQITLMDDWRRADNTRNRYGNITADLFSLSEAKQIPIIAVTQANREVAKKNENKEDPESPKLHEISESDQIAHNSTRVIALSRIDNILKLNIEKNRYGEDKGEVLLNWQIDKGYIEPIIEDEKIIENEYGF